jgi:hypothetical protein
MKILLPRSLCPACLAAAFLVLSACDRSPSAAPPNASYASTREFWDTIHQPFVTPAVVEAIKQLKLNDPDEAHAAMVRQGFRGLAQLAGEKNKQITSLTLLNVDPDAVAFAAKTAAYRNELADLCEMVAGKTESDARIPDELLLGVLMGFVRHANDKGGVFWNVMNDSAGKTVDTLSNVRAEWVALAARVRQFGSRGDSLQIEEMTVRASLATRYGHEFPPASSYPHTVGK